MFFRGLNREVNEKIRTKCFAILFVFILGGDLFLNHDSMKCFSALPLRKAFGVYIFVVHKIIKGIGLASFPSQCFSLACELH